jgi:hypothetical protein
MNDDSLVVRRDGWLATQIDDDLIMMSAENDVYLNLTGPGARIWELLECPHRMTDLCELLAGEYVIDVEKARPEVLAFLELLLLQKAIDVLPPSYA